MQKLVALVMLTVVDAYQLTMPRTSTGYSRCKLQLSIQRPPVYLLTRIQELRVATGVADTGLLTTAENAGVFSKLESVGAFSLAEKALPIIEGLKLLSTFEALLEFDWALQFALAGIILATSPALFTLQAGGFMPLPSGPAVGLEAVFALATLTLGGVWLVTSLIIGKLQVPELGEAPEFLQYKPVYSVKTDPVKSNPNTFDKDGRLVKGPNVTLKIKGQTTTPLAPWMKDLRSDK
jgi:hypothetical protein